MKANAKAKEDVLLRVVDLCQEKQTALPVLTFLRVW